MKINIIYNLHEEKEEFTLAYEGHNAFEVLRELDNYMRANEKP